MRRGHPSSRRTVDARARSAPIARIDAPLRIPARTRFDVSTPKSVSRMREFAAAVFSKATRFAFHAGQHPNAVGDDDLAACREHFDDAQITAIVAVCALFGFLNRWNDTMATTLEDVPRLLADRVLAPQGWDLGRHDGDAEASR